MWDSGGFVVVGHSTTTPLLVVRGLWDTHAAPEKWLFVLPRATNRAMSALSGGFCVNDAACGMRDPYPAASRLVRACSARTHAAVG